jgi:hypothetical protein
MTFNSPIALTGTFHSVFGKSTFWSRACPSLNQNIRGTGAMSRLMNMLEELAGAEVFVNT